MPRPSQAKVLKKVKLDRDSDYRVVRRWEAPADCPHGGLCVVTVYGYVGREREWTTMIELEGRWQKDWEVTCAL